MNEHFYAVIMAGGGGTRLWPLSRAVRPKQMLRLNGEQTLFQMATARLTGLFSPERILVVTVAEQAAQLQAQDPAIPAENYLIEPLPRGTASVVGYAAIALNERDPQATMAILTADHFIQNVPGFQATLREAFDVAQQGYLVTLGIEPSYPATGYGYIQRGEELADVKPARAYEALRFKEKPDEETARSFLSGGDHYWNSGMFIWRVDRILAEFQRQMPALTETLSSIASVWSTNQRADIVAQLWPGIKPETIDYGIMENALRVAVLPANNLGWNDVGSWESLFDVLPGDPQGNIVQAEQHLEIDTRSSLVLSEDPKRLIVTIGVEDLVIVDTGDALLIAHKDQSQRVREVVKQLKETGQTGLL